MSTGKTAVGVAIGIFIGGVALCGGAFVFLALLVGMGQSRTSSSRGLGTPVDPAGPAVALAGENAASVSAPPSKESAQPIIEAKCRAEWADDFRMQKYCQDKQHDGLRELQSREMAGSPLSGIRNKCTEDWAEDFRMRAYCEEKQLSALRALSGQ